MTKPDAGHKDNWRKLYGKVEVGRMCYAISRGKNSKKPYLKQLELICNFNGSSKAKYQNGVKYLDAYWTLYCFCQSDNFPFADQPLN